MNVFGRLSRDVWGCSLLTKWLLIAGVASAGPAASLPVGPDVVMARFILGNATVVPLVLSSPFP